MLHACHQGVTTMNLSSLQNGSDIRGIALGEHPTLTPKNADVLSRAFVVWLAKQTKKSQVRVAVGMDSRLSGPALRQACLKALQDSGAFVIDCGMASTPAMFMTTVSPHTECDGAIMITASHLPSDRNGMSFSPPAGWNLPKSNSSSPLPKRRCRMGCRAAFLRVISFRYTRRIFGKKSSRKPAAINRLPGLTSS
ncbi:MAG: hypothetical protein ACLT0Y_08260 [Christensenellales bacterium]